jgi:hypothetical protein
MSGNTFGAQRYSDGFMFAPMLPKPPQFPECNNCHRVYELGHAERAGESVRFDTDDKFKDAVDLKEPTLEALRNALFNDDEKSNFKDLISLQYSAFLIANHPERSGGKMNRPEWYEENVRNLIPNASEETFGKGSFVILSELYRTIGDFANAKLTLDNASGEDKEKLSNFTIPLLEKIEAMDRQVYKLT